MAVRDTVAGSADATPGRPAVIPPLESGDRLTRPEFERRYEAMPHVKKAELIEGVVYVTSAVRVEQHGEPHGVIMVWIGTYGLATPGVRFADNTTVRLDPDNEPQPDAFLRIEPESGGQSRVSADGYLEGPPELVVEIAASSATYDLHDKLRAYRRNGVQEYVVWRVLDGAVDWFRLREGEYVRLQPDADGAIRSQVFPGLWLAVSALLAGDYTAVQSKLQEGLTATEHAEFAERPGAAKKRSARRTPWAERRAEGRSGMTR